MHTFKVKAAVLVEKKGRGNATRQDSVEKTFTLTAESRREAVERGKGLMLEAVAEKYPDADEAHVLSAVAI